MSLLPVDFIFVRLNDWHATPAIQMARVGNAIEGRLGARDVTTALQRLFGDAATHPPGRRLSLKGVEFHITYRTLAGEGELGFVFAGSQRTDFSEQTDASLLDIAVSQLAIRLQHVRDLNEQKKDLSRLATANEELKASERDSRLILDNIPGLVAVLTETGDVESVNRQVFEYFGQNLDELRQWGTNDTVHPEDLPTVIDVFGRSIQSGVPYNIVQRFRRCDGVYRWFQNRGFPLRDTDGRIVLWCVLLSDIDDQKRAEDAVRASERNLKLIIDTMPALAWSARADGSAEFFNQHYLDYLGVSAEQAQDWGWTAALHPDDSQDLAATWQRIMASGRLGEAQARLRRHDGEYRWFLFRANPLRDEQGIIIQWYGVNADIEERRQAEAELRRAYESFADAQRLSRTGNFIADIVADDHKWSAELYRIFEIEPPTEIKLQLVHDMIHPEDVVAFDAGFQRSLGGANFDEVFRIVTSSGNVKHVHAVGHLIERIAGRPLFVGAIQDVTDRKIADEALNRARSELANMTRVATLSALTASIAHEINQPLSGIITNAGTCLRMLERDPPNISGARETARRTIRDGNRASDVITRLRALFSDKDTALEPVELNDATREVITLSLSDLQRNHVILRLDLAEDLPTVVGDRVQLQQVILNLVRNGCDAMVGVSERPRELLIRTERDGDGVRVTVRDAGTGIDRAIVDKLFQPFYSTKPGGMGIGLSLSRSIMERHHGRLWAEANEGPGATFSLFIPQSRES
ncbi:MAG TPA: PAS domain-containing protein [Bryobacteraceae bacterium]|nr:PAS domain-containing protein [Bryobacteraceae bacterium]